MGIENISTWVSWGVGITGALAAVVTKLQSSKLEATRDFRTEVNELLVIKDEIIAAKDEQLEALNLENGLMKDTIASQNQRLEEMSKRLDALELQHERHIQQLMVSASQTSLCLNAPNCPDRQLPSHE